MEVLLKGSSKIDLSPKKIHVSATKYSPNTDISLFSLSEMDNYARVNVEVKVHSVSIPGEAAGRKMQQLIIVDNTGSSTVTLWEKDIDSMVPQKSYRLEGFLVRLFGNKRYLTMGRQGSKILDIEDIGEVCLPDAVAEDESEISEPQIVAIASQDSYSTCLRCSSRVDPITPPYSRCTSCQMMQLLDACKEHETAKFMFLTTNRQLITLSAVGNLLLDMAEFDTSERNLMSLSFSSIKFNNINNTIMSFVKKGDGTLMSLKV